MSLIANPNDFLFVRSFILNRPTATEYQIASRIVKTIDPLKNDAHEARFATYKKYIHQLWDQIIALCF
jgi:hypothetical protein